MKALIASVFAALFALASTAGIAAAPMAGQAVFNSEDAKDGAKSPTTDTESKNDDDKKKPEEDDKKS